MNKEKKNKFFYFEMPYYKFLKELVDEVVAKKEEKEKVISQKLPQLINLTNEIVRKIYGKEVL